MKTLKELADELREMIIDLHSDAHNKVNFRPERYNNLKLDMKISQNPNPHVIITLSMSSAEFDLKTHEKTNGGLGQDEKYAIRWLEKPNTIESLMNCWSNLEKNRGRISDKYSV